MIDAAQLGKIAARIESIHDGEALNAARMLVKRLGGHGLRLSDVIESGINGEIACVHVSSDEFRRYSSPPATHHRTKIDALLSFPAFIGEYLTRRSMSRLASLRQAPHVDAVTMDWIDGLLAKAREFASGRAA